MLLPSSADLAVIPQLSCEPETKKVHGFGFGAKHAPLPLSADLAVTPQCSHEQETKNRHGFGFGVKHTPLPLSEDLAVTPQLSHEPRPEKRHGFGFGANNFGMAGKHSTLPEKATSQIHTSQSTERLSSSSEGRSE